MPITLSPEDAAFLDQVEELGRAGLSQEEIAARLEMNPSTFRYRVQDLGFRFDRAIFLRAKPQHGGRPWTEMRGEAVVVEKPATAGAA